ncbi:ParB N-terminal domain-containing protein [Bacillus thuringiensis]|uniref:ParB N-terminal domain-containing protein n=1 Tax=Bacillus thuringiensis TaxID=1428 RepID=UPI0011AAC969|nr:ParB N-terminal domain-containing protein [Bacillus thuringiensis]
MLLDINQIKVAERIRKEFGNIEELANDIKENGLINPPVVTPEHELIAGERRLRACKYLNYQQIEVRVMSVRDYEHKLKIEIGENEHRKEFTFSERMAWARELERVESAKAREREKSGKKIDPTENFPQGMGTTRDIVAEKIGIGSGKQYEKAKFIAENADPSTIAKLDNKETSIHKAFTELKAKLKEKDKLLYQETEKRKRAEQETFAARKSEELTRKQLEEREEQKPQIIEKEVVKTVEVESEEHNASIKQLKDKVCELEEKLAFQKQKMKVLQKDSEELQDDSEHMNFMAKWTVHTFRAELEELVKQCSLSSLQSGAIVAADQVTKDFIRRDVGRIRTLMDRIEDLFDHTFMG